MRENWNLYFMRIAKDVSSRATCPRKSVGAVLTFEKRIVATGYNGSVQGESHCDEVGCDLQNGHCVRTLHAEVNALLEAGKEAAGSTLYVTCVPCWSCFKMLAQAGVLEVYFADTYGADQRVTELALAAAIGLVRME